METTKQTPVQGTGNNPETFTVSKVPQIQNFTQADGRLGARFRVKAALLKKTAPSF